MLDFEVIPTEYTDGAINGTLYTSKVRVVARSPEAFMFVGYGLHITRRNDQYSRPTRIASDAKRESLIREDIRDKIEAMFGEGAHAAILKTLDKRGYGTVLISGGGKKLRLPSIDARKVIQGEYSSVTPYIKLPLDGSKVCIQCGEELKPHCAIHHMGTMPLDDTHPRSLEDCQRLTNYPVMEVVGYSMEKPRDWWPYVSHFYTWDGESYTDDTFCGDRCAAKYGRRAAAELPRLEVGKEPLPKARLPHAHFNHYDVEAEEERRRVDIERSFAKLRPEKKP